MLSDLEIPLLRTSSRLFNWAGAGPFEPIPRGLFGWGEGLLSSHSGGSGESNAPLFLELRCGWWGSSSSTR